FLPLFMMPLPSFQESPMYHPTQHDHEADGFTYPPKSLVVLGAGKWGTTLARLFAQEPSGKLSQVTLWDRTPEKLEALKHQGFMSFGEQTFELPQTLRIESNLQHALHQADIVVMVVSSSGTASMAERIKPYLHPDACIVNASKGFDLATLQPLSRVLYECFKETSHEVAVLSGPNLAKEVVEGLPTAAVVASQCLRTAERLQHYLSTERFRLYTNTDVIGVELGGALKNIFAIVSGYMDGCQMGANARAALITRALAEMTRFSMTLGAKLETIYGLSGLGDMLATCSSPLSRNYQVGFRLSQGQTLPSILQDMNEVAEGVSTTQAVQTIIQTRGMEAPIMSLVAAFLSGMPLSEEELIRKLMTRKLCSETPKTPCS
ncbi:MAG: NAD(P)H-dependent glycerol-3-phosphate dehydrogenase, partial [Vampirovibrionales bacterium]